MGQAKAVYKGHQDGRQVRAGPGSQEVRLGSQEVRAVIAALSYMLCCFLRNCSQASFLQVFPS